MAVDCLRAVLNVDKECSLAYFDKLAIDAEPILGTHPVELFLHYAMFLDYLRIRPFLLRMLTSSQPAMVQVAARQIALAALWIEEARGDEEIVLQTGEEARAGATYIYANSLSDKTVGGECEERLRTLFVDEIAQVRQAASRWWAAQEPDELASRGPLISAFAESMDSDDDVSTLAYRLKEAWRPLPAEVCTLAERAIGAYSTRAASVEYREAGAAYMLAPLLVRLHEQTDGPLLRERILNVIDATATSWFLGNRRAAEAAVR